MQISFYSTCWIHKTKQNKANKLWLVIWFLVIWSLCLHRIEIVFNNVFLDYDLFCRRICFELDNTSITHRAHLHRHKIQYQPEGS